MTPWTLRLILANVAVFLLTASAPQAMDPFVLVPAEGWYRPWTFVTYMFLHGGFGHLFFNMLSLFFFGPRTEDRLGGRAFLGLYFSSGIMGALLSLVFTPHAAIIGASGAVFGVLLAYAWYWPRDQMLIWGIIPIESRWMVLIMTAISLYGARGGGSGIAHFAHLGGFLGGYIFLKLLERTSGAERFKRRIRVTAPRLETVGGALERWKKIRRDQLHEINREELDRVLDKISASGIGSLSQAERDFLDRFSQRH